MRRVGCALVHHPVLDRERRVVTAAITNIDLHDISRSALSFGLCGFWVTHPIAAQRTLAERVREHWVLGSGGRRIPDRKPALELLRVVDTLERARVELGANAEMWSTSAEAHAGAKSFAAARRDLARPGPPVLLVFGTGWGLSPEVHASAAARLSPIASLREDGYNHLSVRAAAAIILDRLVGGM